MGLKRRSVGGAAPPGETPAPRSGAHHGWDLLAASPVLFLAIYIALMSDPDTRWQIMALELSICVAAAASTRWTVAGSVATGVLLMLLALTTDGQTRMSAFACVAPIIVAGGQGRWRLTVGLTAWYLTVLAVLEAPDLQPLNLMHAAMTWSLVLCIAVVLAAGLDRIRTQRIASEQRREAELLEQRRAIARELHDTIAHTATLTLLRATTAREHLDDKPLITADLDFMAAACKQMTVDLRKLLAAIRGPVDEPIADEPQVSPRAALATAKVTLERAGFRPAILPDGSLDDLPPATRQALVRTITEAAANIARHGDPSKPCSLLLERTGQGVEFVATNTVCGARFRHGNGFGLLGLGERIRSLGGELNVSNNAPNWVLHARIPFGQNTEAALH